jgi:hypothetical protein
MKSFNLKEFKEAIEEIGGDHLEALIILINR